MADGDFRLAARKLMLDEQAPTLRTPDVDLVAYADSLLARYENRAIKHRTGQIATDGTQKLPQRWLDSIRWHIAQGSAYPLLALGVAAWIRYVGAVDEQGNAIEVRDAMKSELAERVAASAEGEARVAALLGIESVFGEDLPHNADFVAQVNDCYQQLLRQGARATVAQAVANG